MDLGLKGRVALVGGGSSGLGRAVARALLLEGAQVTLAARRAEVLESAARELAQETGTSPSLQAADLGVPADRESVVRGVERRSGRLDVLVVNAGGPPAGPFEAHGPREWQLAYELSLGAATHLCALALPGMKERRFGRILQIVSVAGLEAMEGLILSNALRPAVLGLGKALAREAAPFGVLVNSLCPGIFLTDRVRDLCRAQARAQGIAEEEALARFCGDIPVGRPGRPEELGDVAAFLCSPRNTYLTGAAIVVDGGKTRRLV
jgi:3-oxoacyl-[acyl-carrier protein] reductase